MALKYIFFMKEGTLKACDNSIVLVVFYLQLFKTNWLYSGYIVVIATRYDKRSIVYPYKAYTIIQSYVLVQTGQLQVTRHPYDYNTS